jgi:ABC-type dipeptide/oligopeptide/nickel transport system permease subunit
MLGALAIGLLFGTLAGYFGGFVDEALSWIINILLALSPILGLSIILGMPAKTRFLWTSYEVVLPRTDKVTVALILIGWPICANIIRSEVFRIRHRTHSKEPEVVKVSRRQAWKTYLTQVLHAACLQLGSAV